MIISPSRFKRSFKIAVLASVVACFAAAESYAVSDNGFVIPVNRSSLVQLNTDISEIVIANPEIADAYPHGTRSFSIIGKRIGGTTVRVFDKNSKSVRAYNVMVGYDLPAVRRALKNFLPQERIAVEMVNTNLALTGSVSSAEAAEKAMKIVSEFVKVDSRQQSQQSQGDAAGVALPQYSVLNLMKVASGQQVMLRVRIGEIQREALKELGVDMTLLPKAGSSAIGFGTGAGWFGPLVAVDGATAVTPGSFLYPSSVVETTRGGIMGRWQPNGTNGKTVAGVLTALERDGVFKLLAEPNLVAISGEQAEFLAGGEIPVPVPQSSSGGGGSNITIEYKQFGVGVKFRPFVLSEQRLRLEVQPEVSELDFANAVQNASISIPAITTRRAKTAVELAPGESIMIAGLIKDQTRASIDQMPGVKELPVLGALFRSTEFRKSETELVIAVTPYLVDPVKSSDIKLPTDNFQEPSQLELFLYGALSKQTEETVNATKHPSVEGPIGFMVE